MSQQVWKKKFVESSIKCYPVRKGENLIEFMRGNILHNEGFPARFRFKNNKIIEISYFENGSIHRPTEDGPAVTYYFHDNGELSHRYFYVRGELHRPENEGPAELYYYSDGKILRNTYYHKYEPYRDHIKGALSTKYRNDGTKKYEKFYYPSHNYKPDINKPTMIKYYRSGIIKMKKFYDKEVIKNGPHYDFPTLIFYNESGYVEYEEYFYQPFSFALSRRIIDDKEFIKLLEWYNRDYRPSDLGPAKIYYYENYIPRLKVYNNGNLYWVEYYEDGKVKQEEYCRDESEGPSTIKYDNHGNIIYEEFLDIDTIYNKRQNMEGCENIYGHM